MARRQGRRTDYQWTNFGDATQGADLGVDATFGPTALTINIPGTVTRIRGKIGVVLDTGGVDESAIILCGIMIAPSDVVIAGSTPELFTTGVDEASWIWQGALYVNSGGEAAVITEFLSDSIDVDTKAMRRVKPNEDIVFVHQAPAALANDQAGTYDISYYLHVLLGS